MIPILYKEDETNFNHNGIGQLTETIDYEVFEARNGEFELTLQYPISGKWFSEIKDMRLILAEPNEIDDDHLFRIYETVKDLSTQSVMIYATTKTNDLGGNLVTRVDVKNSNPQQALDLMKGNLVEATSYNFVSDIDTISSTEWIRRNPLNCIAGEEGSIIDNWGGEIKRTNDTIFIYSRRGKDNVTTIRQGKNLEGFTLTASTKGLVTRILPIYTYTPEGKDEEVTLIGDIVNSPLMANYPVRYLVPVDYSQDESVADLAGLNRRASSYFKSQNPGVDKPSVSIDVDLMQLSDSSDYAKFKGLERIGLTDTVTVWVEKFNVDVTVKINDLTYNGMKQQVTHITAGSKTNSLYDDVRGTYKQDIGALRQYIEGMENGVRNTIQLSADQKNTIFRGYSEPDISMSKLNDLWFKEIGSGETEMYIFDGAYWQPLITAGLNEAVKAEVEAMQAKAEADAIVIEEALEKALLDAKQYTELKAKEFDEELQIVTENTISMTESANEAVLRAEKAMAIAEAVKDGEDAITLHIDSANGSIFKNTNVATILTVTVLVAGNRLDTSEKLRAYYGLDAFIQWHQKPMGELFFTEVPLSDTRLSDNGFIFSLTTQDVGSKTTFNCDLIF